MDLMKENWFSEKCDLWPGSTVSFEVEKVLHSEQSRYQHILVLETRALGRVLVLDGIIQCTQKDEFSYQEMISFLPLCCHERPEKVLIVGGGDGGVAREVAKHPLVREIHQVEIDERVIEVSKQYLPFMAEGFASDKLTLHVDDGFQFMRAHENAFDVIITDSSDPVGPARALFGDDYFALVRGALRPGGVACSQAGTVWNDAELVRATLGHARRHFPVAAYAYTCVPTYPSGQIGFVLASLEEGARLEVPRGTEPAAGLRYYTRDIHSAAFVLPAFVRTLLQSEPTPPPHCPPQMFQ